jgi:hypothetical protein
MKIIQDNKSTAAPPYIGMMVHYKKAKEEVIQFFFCNDDLQQCVKGGGRSRLDWMSQTSSL